MHGSCLGVIETQDGRCKECALELVGAAVDNFAAGIDKLVHRRCHVIALLERNQWTHRGILIARITRHNLGLQALRQSCDEWLHQAIWHNRAANRRTFLPRL